MAVNLLQKADGTLSLHSEQLGKSVLRLGGNEQPIAGSASALSTIAYHGSSYIKAVLATAGAGAGTGGLGTILNPFPNDVIVGKTIIHCTSAQSTLTVGISIGTGSSMTAFGNNIIDAVQISAVGEYDNITNKGTAGLPSRVWSNNTYITMTASNTPLTFTGNVYIEVINP